MNLEAFIDRYQKIPVEELGATVPSPVVSVCVPTYNHAGHIAACLDSILAQKASFPFEILVGDDASTDGTREICIEYANKYPERIKLFLHRRENNIEINGRPTGRFNATYALLSSRGRYIAICEGDDMWTDSTKLERQVQYLEQHSKTQMVCTDYSMLFMGSSAQVSNNLRLKNIKDFIYFEDYIIDRSSICTATCLFRNSAYREYMASVPFVDQLNFVAGDTPMWLFFAKSEPIAVMPESTAVYRILQDSASRFTDPEKHYSFMMKGMEIPEYFVKHFGLGEEFQKKLDARKARATLNFAYETNNKELFFKTYRNARKNGLALNRTAQLQRVLIMSSLLKQLYKRMKNK